MRASRPTAARGVTATLLAATFAMVRRVFAAPRGCPGRCEHRPLQRLQQCGVRDFTGGCKPAVGRRGGIYPSRGRSNRRGARRDEGIPPYGRPGGCGCPVWPVVPGRFVGEGHSPPAGLAAARGPRDDASIVPYRGLRYRRRCGSPVGRGPCRFVGADSISARGCLRQRRARRDEGIPPYGRPGGCGFPVGRGPTVGRRGGIYPSRGHLRRRGAPGTILASSPTEVCGLRRRAFKSWLTRLFKNAPALAGAKLWWASQGPRHPRPKKQSTGLFFAACAAGLSSPG